MRLQFEHMVRLPKAAVFAFYEDPQHLALLHRGWSQFRMLHHEGRIEPGSRTWFEMTVAGILPIALGFEHTFCEPPQQFSERLIHGPFQRFEHTHEFETAGEDTIVRDVLEVELPWYYGGEPAMRFVAAPMLRKAFRSRGLALVRLAQEGQVK